MYIPEPKETPSGWRIQLRINGQSIPVLADTPKASATSFSCHAGSCVLPASIAAIQLLPTRPHRADSST